MNSNLILTVHLKNFNIFIYIYICTLSNSSIQQTPLSASISAPASIQNSPVSTSLLTLAVNPAALEAFPDVYTALGRNEHVNFKNYDLAVDGSPTMHTFISPLILTPSLVFLLTPPISINNIPFLTSSCPYTAGAMLDARFAYKFGYD